MTLDIQAVLDVVAVHLVHVHPTTVQVPSNATAEKPLLQFSFTLLYSRYELFCPPVFFEHQSEWEEGHDPECLGEQKVEVDLFSVDVHASLNEAHLLVVPGGLCSRWRGWVGRTAGYVVHVLGQVVLINAPASDSASATASWKAGLAPSRNR